MEQLDLILELVRGIDGKTTEMDSRLRKVENKLNDGLSTQVEETNENVKATNEEQARLKLKTETHEAKEESRNLQRDTVLKVIGVLAAVATTLFAILATLGVL